ncbi:MULTISPECIES: hypothetical protein [Bacteria]|uniref:hypothetical protein n=1 Tax=Bacteria TaxID=2 RepID=UPI003F3820D0
MKEGFVVFFDTPHNTHDFSEIDGIFFKNRGETFNDIDRRLIGFKDFIKENGLTPTTYEIQDLKTKKNKIYTISESIKNEYENFEINMLSLSKDYIFENSFKIEVYKTLYNYHKYTGNLKETLAFLYEEFLKCDGFSLATHEDIEIFLNKIR